MPFCTSCGYDLRGIAPIKQVTEAISSLDKITQENAANSEEFSATVNTMDNGIAHLNQLIGQFKVDQVNQTLMR